MSLREEKKELRRRIKQLAMELSPEYCRLADREIVKQVTASEAFQRANTVFCFVGTAHEIDTWPIIEAAWQQGKRVGVPKCLSMGHMEVYRIERRADLELGFYGISEPKAGLPLLEPQEIEFAILPCLSCNREGYRLGYGGGFYDRYLERMACPNAVICRSKLMSEEIPVETFDKKADAVITENTLL